MSSPLRVVSDFTNQFRDAQDRPITCFELTTRTVQGRFLLLPRERHVRLILGVLGRVLTLLGIELYAYAFMSNHYSLLVGVRSARLMSRLAEYLNSNIARELGRKEHSDWTDKFWGRRVRAIPILTEADLYARMKYLLSNSTKEHLVLHPALWPGAHCARALCSGTVDTGDWIDRTLISRSKGAVSEAEATTRYPVKISKLPSMRHLSDEDYRQAMVELCAEIAGEARRERKALRKRTLGTKRALRFHPHHRPGELDKSPAPLVHCRCPELYAWFKEQYRAFVEAYRAAYRALQKQVLGPDSLFPPGGIAPSTSGLAHDY